MMKTATTTEKKATVHEIFVSRQGEGLFVGAKQVFLRFSRCNIACNYCDTDNSVGAAVAVDEIAAQIERLRWQEPDLHSLSLTGGEPLLHAANIPTIADVARQAGLLVFLETNGTLPEAMRRVRDSVDIVSMDIKIPSVGKTKPCWREHAAFLRETRGLSRYVKMVLSEETDLAEFQQAVDLIAAEDPQIPTVLQPVTPVGNVPAISAEKLSSLKETALAALWDVRIQPQWHKLWNVK